jgi:hypothetical protein
MIIFNDHCHVSIRNVSMHVVYLAPAGKSAYTANITARGK